MAINGDDPAFPAMQGNNMGMFVPEGGLTKREYFAGLIMQGMMANPVVLDLLSQSEKKIGTEATDDLVVGMVFRITAAVLRHEQMEEPTLIKGMQ